MRLRILASLMILAGSAPVHAQIKWYKFDKGFIQSHYQSDGSSMGSLAVSAMHPAKNVHSISCGGNDGSITLPYWDWTGETSPEPAANSLWADDFLGPDGDSNDGQRVQSGPFTTNITPGQENWVLTVHDPMDNNPVDFLQRSMGQDSQAPTLPTPQQLANVVAIKIYDSSPWDTTVSGTKSFRNALEGWVTVKPAGLQPGMHNRVHVWVGGSMLPMSSPNDPIFFLNHCNVDRIWASWQALQSAADQFPPKNGEAQTGHNRDDVMVPWDGRNDPRTGTTGQLPRVTPVDLLDLGKLGYSYDALIQI